MLKSIKIKILLIFSLILILSSVLVGFITYSSTSEIVTEVITSQASGIANQAVEIIDLNKYEQLVSSDKETDYYYELREQLNKIREANGVEYLYTINRVKNDKGYDYVYIADGMPVGHEDESQFLEVEEDISEFPSTMNVFESGTTEIEMGVSEEYGALATAYIPIKNSNGEIISVLGVDIDVSKFYNSLATEKRNTLIISAIILFISLAILYFFTSSITKPIKKLTLQVKQMGNGDFSNRFVSKRKDEIGILSSALQQMSEDIRSVIERIHQNSVQLAESSTTLQLITNETKQASDQIALTMEAVSDKSTSQFHSLNESAKVIEELAVGVTQIAEAASKTSDLSYKTVNDVENGKNSINSLTTQMNTIEKSVHHSAGLIGTLKNHSDEITSIITLIKEISAQTNLLALNAAIEAARAGEAGKGFAVVANEVRKLAEQTEHSTSGIQQILDKIDKDTTETVIAMDTVIHDVKNGLQSVDLASNVFSEILFSVNGMSQQVIEVTTTAEQMTASTEEVSASALEASNIAEGTAVSTQETVQLTTRQQELMTDVSATIESISSMSNELNNVVTKFKL
ncbi:methyl-accepting chemotaxis protein [Metabacillus endolithicus]|uniref:Methyl-accepting chemotaxis protein n=1 Tax=Metabacillus endolithicus TaxID=1535204 RepID=A0ABW5BV81_9BACI|nr:methyl-accepting chemotaxis protein [Metabacillus endolithicus]UPG62820.1 methyl-accepting chemotaxis protein [Metabacillus endolithicus]